MSLNSINHFIFAVEKSCVSFEVWIEFLNIIMCSLHDVHELNSRRADRVCPSVRMIQLENRWTDLDEIYYGRCAIRVYPKIVLLINFLQLVIPAWRTDEHVRWDRQQRHLILVHTMTYGNRSSKDTQYWYSTVQYSICII
jgi:hypothetical protein